MTVTPALIDATEHSAPCIQTAQRHYDGLVDAVVPGGRATS
jgi:hypothetical protein